MSTISACGYSSTLYAGNSTDLLSSTDADSIFQINNESSDQTKSSVQLYINGELKNGTRITGLAVTPIRELPEDQYQEFVNDLTTMLEGSYTEPAAALDTSSYAQLATYATVKVGGQVVAKIDNQGTVSTYSNSLSERLSKYLEENDIDLSNGPKLAQLMASIVKNLSGGRTTAASTALTQRQYDALPTIEQAGPTVNYEAMKSDPFYTQLQTAMQKRAEYLSQQQNAQAAQSSAFEAQRIASEDA